MSKTFTVMSIPLAERNFLDILASAKQTETEDMILRSMEEAGRLLRIDAANVGEPIYDLHQMKMRVRRILVLPLYIEFGVHFSEPVCLIRRVVLLRQPN